MAIVKWKGRIISFTVAWPLVLFGGAAAVVICLSIVRAVRERLIR